MNYRNIELLNDISPATCDWILRNTLYQEWKGANSGVLWIKGNPGTGKSTLLAFVFQEFANEIKNDATQSDQLVLAFFFHARGTILQKTRLGMFRTFLFQLLKAVPQSCTPLLEDFVERQESVLSGERVDWHENELGTFLKKILSTPGFPRRVIMFLDALDEAGKQVANELIEYFHELLELATSRGVKLKICFSSRPYPILIGISSVANIVVQNQNNEGIVRYIQNFLQKLSPNDTVKKHNVVKEFEELIVTNAKGVFQWARLVLERLAEDDRERESLARLRTLLREIPQDPYKMYHHLLTEILGEKKHYTETTLLFQWVCFADHPLSVDELCQAMAFDDEYFSFEYGSSFSFLEADRADFEIRVKVWSAGLIEVKQHFETTTVQIIHQSVGEFLREEGGGLQTLLPTFGSMMKPMGERHARLTRACLNYLRQPHMESVANQIESLHCHRETRKGTNVIDDHHFLGYVRDCWYIHAREAEKCCHVQFDLVERLGFPGKKTFSLFGLKPSFREGRVFRTWLAIYLEYAIQRRLDFYTSIAFTGTTLLHLAVSQNLHSIIDELERRGVSVTERDATGQTALHYAARGGHILMVKRLLRRSFGSSLDVDAEGSAADGLSLKPPLSSLTGASSRVTALMIAVWSSHTEIINLLLQKKAKIKVYTTDLHLLERSATRSIETTTELLIADRKGFQGQNLVNAVLVGDAYTVGAWINQGAIVNIIDRSSGLCPLHVAALIGSLEIVNLLVDAGAELNISYAAIANPISRRTVFPPESVQAVHPNPNIPATHLQKLAQIILAKMNIPILTGFTPLRIAAEKGYLGIVERLLAAGADVNTL
jgi:ankyrin repeat protein